MSDVVACVPRFVPLSRVPVLLAQAGGSKLFSFYVPLLCFSFGATEVDLARLPWTTHLLRAFFVLQ